MTHAPLRIVFAGTPDFAAVHLRVLLEHPDLARVVGVYTQPDRPAGRGKKRRPSPVKALALEHELAVLQPESLKPPEAREALRALDADVMVVVAYGLLLPAPVLDIPRHGCLNVHASLLPRWRGAAPIERAILAGDAQTGVTIMQMDRGLDTGAILHTLTTPIHPHDNSASITARLATLGQEGLLHTLDRLREGSLRPLPQDEAESTYAAKFSKQEAQLDWHRTAAEILRQINAFYPRSPAWSRLGGERVRLLEAEADTRLSEQPPGTILRADRAGLLVACKSSCLLVTTVQLPGKQPVGVGELLNARREAFAPGHRFEAAPAAP